MPRINKIIDGKIKKNAYELIEKKHQARGHRNHKSPSPTANHFQAQVAEIYKTLPKLKRKKWDPLLKQFLQHLQIYEKNMKRIATFNFSRASKKIFQKDLYGRPVD